MAKTIARGTVVKQGVTVIGGIDSVTIPSPEKSEIPVTDFASLAVETIPGVIDFKEVTLTGFLNYADAGQTILRADADDPAAVAKAFTVEVTTQAFKVVFDAFVKTYNRIAGGPNEAYRFESVLRVTGAAVTSALP